VENLKTVQMLIDSIIEEEIVAFLWTE
jgi:hypothetical protein